MSFTQGQQDNRDAQVLKPTSCSASSSSGNLKTSPAWDPKQIFCFQLFLGFLPLTSNYWKINEELNQVAAWPLQTLINTPGSFGPRMEVVGEWSQGEVSCELLGHQWIAGWIFIFLKSNKKKKSTFPLQLPVIMDAVWAKNPAVKSYIYYHSISHQQIYDPFQT